ncbi:MULTISPECIES: hypothetical protein [Bacillaceae]|nr:MULTISPECIES: hypothetical protein [Bacillaceae]
MKKNIIRLLVVVAFGFALFQTSLDDSAGRFSDVPRPHSIDILL